jgi:hypothetical protein
VGQTRANSEALLDVARALSRNHLERIMRLLFLIE